MSAPDLLPQIKAYLAELDAHPIAYRVLEICIEIKHLLPALIREVEEATARGKTS